MTVNGALQAMQELQTSSGTHSGGSVGQIIFCTTSCSYYNMPSTTSYVFQRENNRYPPIWFGEADGVTGIKSGQLSARTLYICWRPAARVIRIAPEDDQWIPLEDKQRPGNNAYVMVKDITTYASSNEIAKVSLVNRNLYSKRIISTPILIQGDTIWFTTDTGDPLANGIIEICHVIYDSYDKTSYSLEVIWKVSLKAPATDSGASSVSYTSGQVGVENKNYTLQEIPS